MIRDFLVNPKYLGAYRATFEKVWDRAVAALQARSPDMSVMMDIAGYWANLLVCTPTWRRVGVEIHNQGVQHTVKAHNVLSAEIGKPDHKMAEAVAALERGDIVIETEADYVRAQAAGSVLRYAWCIYNADWDVFENDTDMEFITSDNPAAFIDQGDNWSIGRPYIRFLPMTPRLCLMCDLTRKPEFARSAPDFSRPSQGNIRGGKAESVTVERINIAIAKCAEELVITTGEDDYVQDLTAKYARFRVETESMRMRQHKGFLIGSRTRVIERPAPP
jgi:hypothetical protein